MANNIFCSLATDTDYVRGRLAEYVDDLLSLGVDGLRLDAAKRKSFRTPLVVPLSTKRLLLDIATEDIANILSRVDGSPYITQEVIYGAGEPVGPAQYTANGELEHLKIGKVSHSHYLRRRRPRVRDFLYMLPQAKNFS